MRVQAFPISFPPRRFIGSELMTAGLLRALADAGGRVRVLVGDGLGAWVWDGLRVTGNALEVFERADVAIVHAGRSWPGVEYRHRTGARLVMICHNTSDAVRADVVDARPDLVVVNSETMRDELGLPGALVVNPPAPVVDPWPAGGEVVALSLNTLKGGPQFLDLARRMPAHRFLAVQSGYGRQHRADLPNLEVLDHMPHPELAARVWARAAVFVQLSESESWGMAAAEAQAHGVPVIAHPTPGLRENLGRAAVWVDRDDGAGLVAAVRRVLGEHDRFRSGALARARWRARVSAVQVGEFVDAIGRLADAQGQRDGAARGLLAGAG